jgi:hypothetical protein
MMYMKKYCDDEKTELEILMDLHVLSNWIGVVSVMFSICMYTSICMYGCALANAWTVWSTLFILGIQEFIYHRLVCNDYEYCSSNRGTCQIGPKTENCDFLEKKKTVMI